MALKVALKFLKNFKILKKTKRDLFEFHSKRSLFLAICYLIENTARIVKVILETDEASFIAVNVYVMLPQ